MNFSPISRRLLWIGGGLIVLVNAIILAGAAWNRSGEESRLHLSQRELHIPHAWGLERETSALALQLAWRVASGATHEEERLSWYWRQADWLDLPRLRELGFDIADTPPDSDAARRNLDTARHAWLVLEFDGDAHAAAVALALKQLQKLEAEADNLDPPDDTQARDIQARDIQSARSHWQEERETRSRLFVIDAGLDPDALRQRYPDRSRHLIVGGLIGIHVSTLRTPEGAPPKFAYVATIRDLDIERIHVPARFHASIAQDGQKPVAYGVTLAYGKRREPWVIAVERTSP